MLQQISQKDLELLLKQDHPSWNSESICEQAKTYLSTLDSRLNAALISLINTGKCPDYTFGEFSIYSIRALRHNCSYFQAILLLDSYMKNSLIGKARILRR